MMKIFSFFLISFLVSCATTMPGNKINTGNAKVSATVARNDTYSNNQIQLYQFSLKNNTNDWIEFDGALLSASKNVSVLVGDRIGSWVEACSLEKSVSDYNTSLILGSIALAGVVATGASDSSTSTAGAFVAAGAFTGLVVKGYQEGKNAIEFRNAFPDKHIFKPVVIPPQKVIQRWILVENPMRENFELNLKNKDGVKVNFSVADRPHRAN